MTSRKLLGAASLCVAAVAGPTAHPTVTRSPLQAWSKPDDSVNCGGHWAESCRVCEAGYGEVWCNGDCTWVMGSCDRITLVTHTKHGMEWIASMWYAWCGMSIFWCIGMSFYAAMYKQKVVDKFPRDITAEFEEQSDGEEQQRDVGLFTVFGQPHTLLWACCCSPVLAAKNYHVAEVCGFWPSCLSLGCLLYSPCPCLAALPRAVMSMMLQTKLRHKPSFFFEFISGLCCWCCAVGRESIEVDHAECMEVKCVFEAESTAKFQEPEIMEEAKEPLQNRSCWDGTKSRWDFTKARVCGLGGGENNGDAEEAREGGGWMKFPSKSNDNGEDGAAQNRTWFPSLSQADGDGESEETRPMWTRMSEAMPKMPSLNRTTINDVKEEAQEEVERE